ncbi:MAG: hypothetical protein BRC41_08215 [Cyanobacteria bacterium QH_9_48_43]|jgi:hypothetical protein|nr:MAG: hypothetical protein BRC41_08215 [Cyanobacteria bacterium QH_9_48_43]
MPFTDYTKYIPKGFEGQVAQSETPVLRSATNADSRVIPYGRVVVRGSNDGEAVMPSSATETIFGVAIREDLYEESIDGDDGYEQKRRFPYMRRGVVYVVPEEAVTPADDVYYRHTANGGNTEIGRFRTDGDSSNATQITSASFLASASAGDIVPLELNLV